MNTALIIRSASESDIPGIRQIAYLTWPSAYGSLLSTEQLNYMLAWMYSVESLVQQMNSGHQFYMAEMNGAITGFASVSGEGEGIFKLNKLYVLPGTQKTGSGKALLQRTISYAKAHNGTRMVLQVNRNNTAKGFYEKHGFTVSGEADLAIGNGYFMNDYIMEMAL